MLRAWGVTTQCHEGKGLDRAATHYGTIPLHLHKRQKLVKVDRNSIPVHHSPEFTRRRWLFKQTERPVRTRFTPRNLNSFPQNLLYIRSEGGFLSIESYDLSTNIRWTLLRCRNGGVFCWVRSGFVEMILQVVLIPLSHGDIKSVWLDLKMRTSFFLIHYKGKVRNQGVLKLRSRGQGSERGKDERGTEKVTERDHLAGIGQ